MDTNPYGAPQAALVGEESAETLASALGDFGRTKLIIRFVAVMSMVCGVVAAFTLISPLTSSLVTLVPGALYLVHGITHWRLASRIGEATAKPDFASIVALLAGLRQSWLASIALYVATALLAVLPGFAAALGIGALSIESALTSNASNEGARLRTVLRVMLGVVSVSSIATFWQQSHIAPTAMRIFIQAFTAAVIGSYGLLVWQQLAPLGAFITDPGPKTLRGVARAHRYFWIILCVAMLIMIACALIAAAVAFMVLPSELPDQR